MAVAKRLVRTQNGQRIGRVDRDYAAVDYYSRLNWQTGRQSSFWGRLLQYLLGQRVPWGRLIRVTRDEHSGILAQGPRPPSHVRSMARGIRGKLQDHQATKTGKDVRLLSKSQLSTVKRSTPLGRSALPLLGQRAYSKYAIGPHERIIVLTKVWHLASWQGVLEFGFVEIVKPLLPHHCHASTPYVYHSDFCPEESEIGFWSFS
jgi:hypothetical protein